MQKLGVVESTNNANHNFRGKEVFWNQFGMGVINFTL